MIFSFIEDYVVEKNFGLSNEQVYQWREDFIKETCIEYVIFMILTYMLYVFLAISSLWWLKIWLIWFLMSFVLAKISPYIILPLFFKFSLLKDNELDIRIKKLAESLGVVINKIWVVDFSRKTKKANAFVTGLGSSKRVGLADNLINNYNPGEIEVVVAHEFAHVKNKDTLKSFLIVGGGSFLIFFLMSIFVYKVFNVLDIKIYDISGLPLFLLLGYIFVFLGLPIYNGISRMIERKADYLALKTIESKENFITLFEKLAKDNLAEINPPLWKEIIFYNHPSIGRRIRMARCYEKRSSR